MKSFSHWSDPTWRFLRITSFVTAGITLICLAVVLAGESSWRYPLAVAVVANIFVMFLVVLATYELRGK
ncbi:MAG TPA: hypothetical protein VNF08_03760 [Acidimicrobiales bacterium]|nr:hypothetical protein [Acidimicrobiales bacterium]